MDRDLKILPTFDFYWEIGRRKQLVGKAAALVKTYQLQDGSIIPKSHPWAWCCYTPMLTVREIFWAWKYRMGMCSKDRRMGCPKTFVTGILKRLEMQNNQRRIYDERGPYCVKGSQFIPWCGLATWTLCKPCWAEGAAQMQHQQHNKILCETIQRRSAKIIQVCNNHRVNSPLLSLILTLQPTVSDILSMMMHFKISYWIFANFWCADYSQEC